MANLPGKPIHLAPNKCSFLSITAASLESPERLKAGTQWAEERLAAATETWRKIYNINSQ